jgi:Type II secretion system (T2SS), protein N
MRVFIIAVVGLVAALAGGAVLVPMSVAADMAASRFPDFKFKTASGSMWDGKLTQVAFGSQYIGDLAVKTDLMPLLGGKAAGALGLTREGFTGSANLGYGLMDGGLEVKDLKLEGNTALVPGMPAALARSDGRFTLAISNVTFVDSLCETASGEVWTDALTKVNIQGWVGPELRGPVTCEGGHMQVQAGGKAATGEDVLAILSISQHLDMELTATVANATPAAAKALGDIGFVLEGDKLVLNQAMGGR